MANRHAVFATVKFPVSGPNGRTQEDSMTFRLGQPVKQGVADARWDRLDSKRRNGGLRVRFDGRSFPVAFLEMRQVDRVGRGLGSERHGRAMPLPLRRDSRARTFGR